MPAHIHVIPLPPEHEDNPQRAWDELCNVGVFVPEPPSDCKWATVECDGHECETIARGA